MTKPGIQVLEKIGHGSFGKVYIGQDKLSGTKVVFKVEKMAGKRASGLHKEYDLYASLGCVIPFDAYIKAIEQESLLHIGFPRVFNLSTSSTGRMRMMMERLGDNLETVLQKTDDKKLPSIAVKQVAIQMIKCLKKLHSRYYIHRDLKPQNITVDKIDPAKFYLLDLGLAKTYVVDNPLSGPKHIQQNKLNGFAGTLRFASIDAHLHVEQGRRDDMQSLGYVLVYLATGELPWQQDLKKYAAKRNIANFSKDLKLQKMLKNHYVLTKKMSTPIKQLTANCGPDLDNILFHYFLEISKMKFNDKPRYDKLVQLFDDLPEESKLNTLSADIKSKTKSVH
jgi:serine/threonine protein kinase